MKLTLSEPSFRLSILEEKGRTGQWLLKMACLIDFSPSFVRNQKQCTFCSCGRGTKGANLMAEGLGHKTRSA